MPPTPTTVKTRSVVQNGALNVLDYAAQPVLLLLAAPLLIRYWGLAEYGVWMLLTASTSAGSNLAAGFADATLKYVSSHRGTGNRDGVTRVLRATTTINVALGVVLAIAVWMCAPLLATAVHLDDGLKTSAILAFRIATPILVLRSTECVLLASIKAFERYGPAVALSLTIRTATIISTVVVAISRHGIVAAAVSTLCVVALGVLAECVVASRVLGHLSLTPVVAARDLSEVFTFASFGGLQGLAGILFSHADRWAVGVLLGTSAVAYYSVCVQIAQPVHGLIAAAFNVVLPHLSARIHSTPAAHLNRLVSRVLRLNIALALSVATLVACFARPVLWRLMGSDFSQHAWTSLALLIVAFALLAGNITGHFTLLALGEAGWVCAVNVAAATVSFALLIILAPHFGLFGASAARLAYGPITWLVYARLRKRRRQLVTQASPPALLVPETVPGSDGLAL